MPERKSYHVVTYVNGWQIREGGADDESGALGVWGHKDLAVQRAREIAKENEPSQVIVHGEDGRIPGRVDVRRRPQGPRLIPPTRRTGRGAAAR